MINQTILHYKIIEKLGEGGMGVVYKAFDTKLKREVAIKFLPHHIAADAEDRKRFEIEAQAAASLNHPNISTIHAIEEYNGDTFIVMEYLEGKDLKRIIGTYDHESLKMTDIVNYAIQIAEGLETAHNKGIIHRDIKSSNIMVTSKGKIKIMDFGLAKFPGRTKLTTGDKTMGTIAYMSPEQSKGEAANFQTDIWSFGVVLYELVTGQLPFQSDYDQAVIYNIMNENPEPVKMLNKKVPDRLANIIHKALEKEPKKRFNSVSELLEELYILQSSLEPARRVKRNFKSLVRKPVYFIPGFIFMLLLILIVIRWLNNQAKVDWARNKALPEIERLTENINIFGEGSEPWTAFELATGAVEYIPDNHLLTRLWPRFSKYVNVYSQPIKASVFAKPYWDTTGSWRYLGQTPLDSILLPVGLSRIKLESKGYQTVYDLINNVVFFGYDYKYVLPELKSLPDEMVLVQGGNIMVELPALSHLNAENVNDFLMDKYEVTNKAYKVFIDSNGYNKQEYWKYPFIERGKQISWKEAMTRFTDKTGRPGPGTWELSNYPNGEDDYPVTGISWYEAAAFAQFARKKLPTVYHWNIVAFLSAVSGIIPLSNINTEGPISVGSSNAMNRFGVYDLAGNVREWSLNSDSNNRRFILGGGWDDPGWAFNDALALSPFNRSKTNGFRCIRYINSNENQSSLENPLNLTFRNYSQEKPVSDETFKFYLNQFNYDKTQLKVAIEYKREEDSWVREKITFNAAYGNERIIAYLFLPKNAKPPYQTVIYFPGSTAIHMHSSETSLEFLVKFLPRDGRAVMYPVYKGTYERGDDLKSDYQDKTNYYKEHVIMWVKDLERSIDYLETRNDIDTGKLAYYGSSWGGTIAPILLAVEKRIRVAVLRGAGLTFESVLPEVDPFNYLPRVKIPVLMLNGRYDFFLPVESSQKPFFEWLGTPEKDKIIRRYETGHGVPRVERIKETVTWLDHYLGSVR